MSTLPLFVGLYDLPLLKKLDAENIKRLSGVSDLAALEYLRIVDMYGPFSVDGLDSLQTLNLVMTCGLTQISGMPSLVSINSSTDGNYLSTITNNPLLERVWVDGSPLRELSDNPKLSELRCSNSDFECAEDLLCGLPSLVSVTLSHCNDFKSISGGGPEALSNLSSIKEILVSNCYGFCQASGLSGLESIQVVECPLFIYRELGHLA
jgi:hypothetical protein